MITYLYRCEDCGKELELPLPAGTAPRVVTCVCAGTARRVFTSVSFQAFKPYMLKQHESPWMKESKIHSQAQEDAFCEKHSLRRER